ncbi:MAG TPA: hypothetical protein VLA93_21215 [Pyrinomonadaceae bacterium]|nr:hypothetical protein [Pyrinomonadaceae bacterium]
MHLPFLKFRYLAVLIFVLTAAIATQAQKIPNPVLYMTHVEYNVINGKEFVRYHYDIENKDQFPASLFARAPSLPPCGSNTNASRTWIDFYDQQGKRLNGFCAIGSPSQLSNLWFALESNVVPPSWVYVEFTDRQTNTKYKSNLAETTQ